MYVLKALPLDMLFQDAASAPVARGSGSASAVVSEEQAAEDEDVGSAAVCAFRVLGWIKLRCFGVNVVW